MDQDAGEGSRPDNNSFSVKVGAEFRAELKGEIPRESVGRAVDAILDTVSPITRSLGLLGDRIQMEREAVLLEVARRAKARLAVQNETEPHLPPKFLVTLLEHASRESIDDDRIIDMWANLLSTAASQRVEMIAQYVTMLSNCTGTQVSLLDRMIAMEEKFAVDRHLDVYDLCGLSGIEQTLSGLVQNVDNVGFAEAIAAELNRPGVCVDCINVSSDSDDDMQSVTAPDGLYKDRDFFEFENLCRLGFLEHVHIKLRKIGSFLVDVSCYVMTPVGADLYACCNPDSSVRGIHQREAVE